MKHLILLVIRIYWLIPKFLKTKCLYKESCSNYVFRITKIQGFFQGLKALTGRIETCRPNYKLVDIDNQRFLICNNGVTIEEENLATWLLKENE